VEKAGLVFMIKVNEIAFCCYAVTDMARARKFYEEALGLKAALVVEGKWVEYEMGPHTLALGSADGWKPSPDGCSVALEVEDFDAAVAHLRAHNVKFRIDPMPTPVCQMAMIFDPDGNSICIHKRKSK
jgi:predicted enzyme related to lactoylglutathione lyase